MKQFIFLLIFCFYGVLGRSQGAVILQDKTFIYQHVTDSAIVKSLKASAGYQQMSLLERDVAYWIAVMRKDPATFRVKYLKPFLSQFPEMQGASSRSLDKELSQASSLSALLPATNLNKAASLQAAYLAEANKFTHTGRNGKSFKQRMEDVGVRECAGENLFEGKADALVSLLLLLIDQGVADYGHRKALLNPAFTKVGVGSAEEKNGTVIMVQVFSCQ